MNTASFPLTEKEFKEIYSKVRRLCVDIIIYTSDGVVLVKRDITPCKGYWHLPGGTVRLGESLREAVIRIAKDETGLKVIVGKQLGVQECSNRTAFGHPIAIVYSTVGAFGELKGNQYGRNVKAFTKLPSKLVAYQRKLLEKKWSV